MAVTASNLVQGAATLYVAPFGTAEPASTNAALLTTPGAGWVDVGGTTGGLKISIDQNYAELDADQVIDRAGSAITKRDVTIETSMAEVTLANLLSALNGGTTSSGTGYSQFTPAGGLLVPTPTYNALLIDGVAPASPNGGLFRRRVIVRKVLSTDSVDLTYKQDTQSVFSVTFTAHYVTSAIAPWTWIDQTA